MAGCARTLSGASRCSCSLVEVISTGRNVELAAMLANLTVDSYLQSLGDEICLILPPSERTCRRLSQNVKSAR